MASLYEINSEMQELLDSVMEYASENDGEITEEMSEELDNLSIERNDKIESTACYIKNLKAESDMIKAEEVNLAKRRKVIDNKKERISEWLQANLAGEKFKSARCTVSYRKSASVSITDESAIPFEFKEVVEVSKVDKMALKKALKEMEVAGCEIVEKQSMTIK
jgi:hypothetical protein